MATKPNLDIHRITLVNGNITTWANIHNTSFFKLTNGPNKLKYFITQDRKGLHVTNTTAYWAHSQVRKKMKCRS